jgi:UDP-glucose 4-epimerase
MAILLVTGGAGFIGSHLVEQLYKDKTVTEIRVVDTCLFGKKVRKHYNARVKYYDVCITDTTAMNLLMTGVDYVFHLAALISAPGSINEPIEYEKINTIGTLTLLELAKKHEVRSFIFSSSCAVYGDTTDTTETTDTFRPLNPYAFTKLQCERYCNMYTEHFGLNTVILRYFNVYGPGQDLGREYGAVVPLFINNILNDRPITIYGDGKQSRDFVHVVDIARANIHAVTAGLTGTYNVGTGVSSSILDIQSTITFITGKDTEILFDSPRQGDMRFVTCNNKKLTDTHFEFLYKDLDAGLSYTI